MRRVAIFLLLAMSACRTASLPPEASPTEGGVPTELAARPVARPSTSLKASMRPSSSSRTTTTPTPGARRFVVMGSQRDAAGDAGPSAPLYADLTSVSLEEDGTSIRVTVTVADAIPDLLEDGEQIGLGVNVFFPGGRSDGDYQFYATGTRDGWFAYFETPSGFVSYPGTFEIDGSSVIFTVPLSSIRPFTTGRFNAFLDRDQRGVVLSQTSQDRAPANGSTPFSRRA